MTGEALRILIVEDHKLIATQMEVIVEQAGHLVVGTAMDADGAKLLAETENPDVVLLDISLAGGESGLDVAAAVSGPSGAHVVFTTANRRRVPDDYCGAVGVVEKPFTRAGLLSALRFIASRISEAEPRMRLPECLQLSPHYEARWL